MYAVPKEDVGEDVGARVDEDHGVHDQFANVVMCAVDGRQAEDGQVHNELDLGDDEGDQGEDGAGDGQLAQQRCVRLALALRLHVALCPAAEDDEEVGAEDDEGGVGGLTGQPQGQLVRLFFLNGTHFGFCLI